MLNMLNTIIHTALSVPVALVVLGVLSVTSWICMLLMFKQVTSLLETIAVNGEKQNVIQIYNNGVPEYDEGSED